MIFQKCMMKICKLILIFTLFISCSKKKISKETTLSQFQEIIDSNDVKGSILVYDLSTNRYYSNDFKWSKIGKLPASTFKIANSIIALETEVVKNDSTLFKWNGEQRRLRSWEQDLIFRDAFHFSCVPCYQDVARKIGAKEMNKYLDEFEYGSMKVDSTNIDIFWLEGESKINQFQQIDFLKRLYTSKLPISERTEKIIKRMMVIEDNNSYKLSGKTGWSIRNGKNNGWFVGYLESRNGIYFFATNINPKEKFDMFLFPLIRKDITHKALKQIGAIR